MPEVTGVVLAGGRSSRFGRDKLAEPFRGAPILHHAVSRVAQVCRDVVLVLAPDAETPELPPGITVRFARDATPDRGPLAGVSAGLQISGTELALVVAGDMPDLQIAVLSEMLRLAGAGADDAIALREGGLVRPVPCVLRVVPAAAAVDTLLRAGGGRLRDLLETLHAASIDEATWSALDPTRRTLFDVDEPSDLDR